MINLVFIYRTVNQSIRLFKMALESLIQNQYSLFILIIVSAFIIAQVVHFILSRHFKRLAEKTKTDIDDIILRTTTKPVYFTILLIGLYFAARALDIIAPYINTINSIFFVVFVLIASLLLSKIFSAVIHTSFAGQKKFQKTPKLFGKVVTIVIYIIAILTILGHFDVEITPAIATLGLGGLAIGLALQSTLSNFFSGLHLLSDKPINVGDFIEIEGSISGYVEDVGWRSTRIKTFPNNIVIVPNSKLADSIITNTSLPHDEISAYIDCGVSYDSDLKKVEKVTLDVAKNMQKTVDGAIKNFQPFVLFNAFGDSNINFTVVLRAKNISDRYTLVHEFIKALKARYDKEKIEISWPVRKIFYGKK